MNLDDHSPCDPHTARLSIDVWRLKTSTAYLLVCEVCGANTRWGCEVGGIRLCDRHWTLNRRFRALLGLPLTTESCSEDSSGEG
jgi:hypothetical protein